MTENVKFLRFRPQLKQTIWGGEKIAALKGLPSESNHVGESWEISAVKGSESIVDGGCFDGQPLGAVVQSMGAALMGNGPWKEYGSEFPLLIKFIDASRDLSIQVHPDDETAVRLGRERGKTEMWYVMKSAPDAKLFNGLSRRIDADTYRRMVEDNTIVDALAQYSVAEGDVFFIPAGRIHSIGSGCFVAEIQQTCDVTYRIYDYDRRDAAGNRRQLHTQEAAQSIHFDDVLDDYRTHYVLPQNGMADLISCKYFSTSIINVGSRVDVDYTDVDSFVVVMATKGAGSLVFDDGTAVPLAIGDVLLLPATTGKVCFEGSMRLMVAHL